MPPRCYFPLNFALDHGGHWQPQRPGRGAGVPLAHVSGQHGIVTLQSGIYSTCDTLTCILLRCQYVKLSLCTLQQHKHGGPAPVGRRAYFQRIQGKVRSFGCLGTYVTRAWARGIHLLCLVTLWSASPAQEQRYVWVGVHSACADSWYRPQRVPGGDTVKSVLQNPRQGAKEVGSRAQRSWGHPCAAALLDHVRCAQASARKKGSDAPRGYAVHLPL